MQTILPIDPAVFWMALRVGGALLILALAFLVYRASGAWHGSTQASVPWEQFLERQSGTAKVLLFVVALVFLLALVASAFVLWSTINQVRSGASQGINLGSGTLIAALLGAPFLIWGTWLKYQTVRFQKEGHMTDRISKAVEQLGAEKTVKVRIKDADGKEITVEESKPNIEVRIGAILSLERIAQDSTIHDKGRDHVRVMEILCAYVRENSNNKPPSEFPEPKWQRPKAEETGEESQARIKRTFDRFGYEFGDSAARKWACRLPPPREDVTLAVKVIGRRGAIQRAIEYSWPSPLSASKAEDREAQNALNSRGGAIPGDSDLPLAENPHLAPEIGSNRALRNCGYRADLSGANLQGLRISSSALDSIDADFSDVDFQGARLEGAIFQRAKFQRANFKNAQMVGASFPRADFGGAILYGADMEGVNLERANFSGTRFFHRAKGFTPRKLGFMSNRFLSEDAAGVNNDLIEVRTEGIGLAFANLEGANLCGADLEGTNLTFAGLERAYLVHTNLIGCSLLMATLNGADLKGAYLNGANLRACDIDRWTRFAQSKLTDASLANIDLTSQKLTQDQLRTTFGDGSVVLAEGSERPDHWPRQCLESSEFDREYRNWCADPASYRPPTPSPEVAPG